MSKVLDATGAVQYFGRMDAYDELLYLLETAEQNSEHPLYQLGKLVEASELLRYQLGETVKVARDDGATWQQVGNELGLTRQAAHMRYGSTQV